MNLNMIIQDMTEDYFVVLWEKRYESVPRSWIDFRTNTMKWPPRHHDATAKAKEASKPEDKWRRVTYNKLMGPYATYEDASRAKKRLVDMFTYDQEAIRDLVNFPEQPPPVKRAKVEEVAATKAGAKITDIAVVAHHRDQPLERVAKVADAVCDVHPISAVTTSQSQYGYIVKKLDQLIDVMTRSRDRPSCSRDRPAASSASAATTLCYYHDTYGDNARKCRPPCTRSDELVN